MNPAFRRQGLAARLFHEACKYGAELRFSYVTTSCRGDGTESFYKALGMQECGRIPDGIYEPWDSGMKYDEILFFKKLTP